MEELFQKINNELPYQTTPKEKRKSLVHNIGGGWYVKTLGHKLPPLKKRKSSKKGKKQGDKIKRRPTDANQEWCDWEFLLHWNKLEWVNPRRRD